MEVQTVLVAVEDGNVYVGVVVGKDVTTVDISHITGYGQKLTDEEAKAIFNAWGLKTTDK